MGGHLSKLNEIFSKIKYRRHLPSKILRRLASPKTWMKFRSCAIWSSRVWHAEQSEIRLWGVICQNSTRYSRKSNIDVICGPKCCEDWFLPKPDWNLTRKHCVLIESDMLNNLRSSYRGKICQNSMRYSRKSNIDVICRPKCCEGLLLPKLEWNFVLLQYDLVESDMLNNLRSAYGGSFVKTQRDILENQISTSFAVQNIAKTCFSQNLNEISFLCNMI